MKNYEWKSDFTPLIHDFLEQYRLAGFKFERQERILQHFDQFYTIHGYAGTDLKKYILEEFIYDKREQKSTHYVKEVVMLQFADFLIKRGYSAYRVVHRYQMPRSKYIPIFIQRKKNSVFSMPWTIILPPVFPIGMMLTRNYFVSFVAPGHGYQKR